VVLNILLCKYVCEKTSGITIFNQQPTWIQIPFMTYGENLCVRDQRIVNTPNAPNLLERSQLPGCNLHHIQHKNLPWMNQLQYLDFRESKSLLVPNSTIFFHTQILVSILFLILTTKYINKVKTQL
jgi:hypothetical protein